MDQMSTHKTKRKQCKYCLACVKRVQILTVCRFKGLQPRRKSKNNRPAARNGTFYISRSIYSGHVSFHVCLQWGRDKVTGDYRQLHSDEFHDLYSQSNIMWVIK